MSNRKFLCICPILITICIRNAVSLPLGNLNDFSVIATKTVSIGDGKGHPHSLESISGPTNLESAQEEYEGPGSKLLSVYDVSQKKVSDHFNPKPLVDTIREEDKYGNDGDKFYNINRAIVGGVEALSNLLNRILDTPVELFKQASRKVSDKLNAVGGKIVGL